MMPLIKVMSTHSNPFEESDSHGSTLGNNVAPTEDTDDLDDNWENEDDFAKPSPDQSESLSRKSSTTTLASRTSKRAYEEVELDDFDDYDDFTPGSPGMHCIVPVLLVFLTNYPRRQAASHRVKDGVRERPAHIRHGMSGLRDRSVPFPRVASLHVVFSIASQGRVPVQLPCPPTSPAPV